MDSASVGKRNHIRQLTAGWKVARDVRVVRGVIAYVGGLFAWVKYDSLFPKSTSNQIKRGDEVRIPTYQREGIGSIAERIVKHVGRNVYICTLLLKLDNTYTSVRRLVTGPASCVDGGHPSLVSVVVAFNKLKTVDGREGTQIDSLPLYGRSVMRICSDSCGVELDLRENMVFTKQGTDEDYWVEPFQLRSSFEKPVVQIPGIDVCNCSHAFEMLRPRPFRIGASPRIGRASRSDINPLTGSVDSISHRYVRCNRVVETK